MMLGRISANEMKLCFYANGNFSEPSIPLSGNIEPNKWYHIVGTRDDVSCSTQIYVNGVLKSRIWDYVHYAKSNSQPLYIGAEDDTLHNFNGIIDDVCIFSKVLTPREIDSLYQGTTIFEDKSINKFPKNALSIFPNPSYSAITIFLPAKNPFLNAAIYNTAGRLVHGFKDISSNRLVWDPKGLPTGVYILKARAGNKTYSKKLLLQK
jgi:hypothetical protein